MQEITVKETQIEIIPKIYNNERVVVFKDIDTVHKRKTGTAKRSFNQNKKHFIENVDFYKVCVDEIRTNKLFPISNKARNDITLITESGYLMIVKSFTDDLSWDVQRQLVNGYFKAKDMQKPQAALPKREDNWLTRNDDLIKLVGQKYNLEYKAVLHRVLSDISSRYNIKAVNEVYLKHAGKLPKYQTDVIDYFVQLQKEATAYLEYLLNL